jgi:uncharacterized membrane protein
MTTTWRIIALGSYFGLLTLLIAWTVWLAPPPVLPTALILIIFVGPLLFPLRGILYGRARAHFWAGLLALFYFIAGVFDIAGGIEQSWLAWLEIWLSILLFSSGLGYVRCTNQ